MADAVQLTLGEMIDQVQKVKGESRGQSLLSIFYFFLAGCFLI